MPKKSLLYVLYLTIGIMLCYFLLKFSIAYCLPIIIGFLIACLLNPFVRKIEKLFKKRGYSTIVAVSIILVIFILSCIGIFQLLSYEISSIINVLPNEIDNLIDTIKNITNTIIEKIPFQVNIPDVLSKLNISKYITSITSGMVDIGKKIPDLLVKGIFMLLFTFFFMLNMEKIQLSIKNRLPKNFSMRNVLQELKKICFGYFLAQGKLFLIMSIILLISFIILGIEYAFLFALLTAFLDLLPIFGTGTILIPYAIIEIIYKDYRVAIGLIVIYIVTQFVRRILEPKILGETIGLSTFMSVLCLFIGYQFFGAFGLILGIPCGVIIKYIYELGLLKNLLHHLSEIKNWIINIYKTI